LDDDKFMYQTVRYFSYNGCSKCEHKLTDDEIYRHNQTCPYCGHISSLNYLCDNSPVKFRETKTRFEPAWQFWFKSDVEVVNINKLKRDIRDIKEILKVIIQKTTPVPSRPGFNKQGRGLGRYA